MPANHRRWYAVSMRIRRLNHCVYQTQYHIVWTTKYRRKLIIEVVKTEIIKHIYKIEHTYQDWHIVSVNTDIDHVHLVIEFPPIYTIAAVVQKLKANTSLYIQKRFAFIKRIYAKNGGLWSVGYFASTVGLNEATIKRYVERQGTYDRGQTINDEFE